jgi:hypothetical protein
MPEMQPDLSHRAERLLDFWFAPVRASEHDSPSRHLDPSDARIRRCTLRALSRIAWPRDRRTRPQLKGDVEAIEQANIAKNCGRQFQKQPAPKT